MADAAAENLTEHQPINFGKRLAHTDKLVRDRGFKTLKKWLQKHDELDRLSFMKLWKGLYFGMWMADKRPVQQELSVNIAVLLGDIPREKQGMWIDTFWETMQASWEKLDIHRISKYLLFIRIVVAEAFKAMRLAGWPLDEMRSLGDTFCKATPMHAKIGATAPSLGLLLQFTRILWEELRPQLQASAASKKAIMSFLEPFCLLAEGSGIDSLVRHIHEQIFRKAPHELLSAIATRILDGAARPSTIKKNRQALYDTADVLEQRARNPLPKGEKPLKIIDENGSKATKFEFVAPLDLPKSPKSSSPGAAKSPKSSPAATASKSPKASSASPKAAEAAQPKKKGKKRKITGNGGVSPLMLPEAALPLEESDALPKAAAKGKRKAPSSEAGSAAANAGDKQMRKKRKKRP